MKHWKFILPWIPIFALTQNHWPWSRFFDVSSGYVRSQYNTYHARNLSSGIYLDFGFGAMRKLEKKSEQHKFLIFGIYCNYHTYGFQSYYFYPDSLKIYDETFPVRYRISSWVPGIQSGLKFELNRSDKYKITPYFRALFIFRSPVFYKMEYTNDKVKRTQGTAYYRNAWIGPYVVPCGEFSIGMQYNFLKKSNMNFYTELGYFLPSATYLVEKNFLPSGLYFRFEVIKCKMGLAF